MAAMRFRDRRDAGRRLAPLLEIYRARDPVVLALPRGGVEVAYEVADALDAPLDVLVVRKLGVPGHEELGFGALGEGGERVLNDSLVERLGLAAADIELVAARELQELQRRVDRYRAGRSPVAVRGRTAIVVDDGLATGATAAAALKVVRSRGPSTVVLAVPVAPSETARSMAADGAADHVIVPVAPPDFMAVGQWYDDFSQTTDQQVIDLLHQRAAA